MSKKILMSGCSRSVGKVTADKLRGRGHQIYGVGLGGPDLDADFLELTPTDVMAIVESARESMGGLDTIINNAGITRIRAIEDQEYGEDWASVMHVNLSVPYMFAQSLIHLAATKQLDSTDIRVINIASMGARYALRQSTSYCVSKAGLVMMTRQMAKECAGKLPISHFAISPNGISDTNMINQAVDSLCANRGMTKQEALDYNCQAPIGRLCHPDEVAEIIRYCVEDAVPYMSGHNFELLGGMSA